MQLYVLGFINHTHPAAAQLLHDAVVRDGLANDLGGCSHGRKCYDAIAGGSMQKTLATGRLLKPRVLGLGLLKDRGVGVGVFQCGVWSRCAKNLFWHSFADDSKSPNSGVPRSFTSNGSVCKAV